MDKKKLETINEVKLYLGKKYSNSQVETLIHKYRVPLSAWVSEYLFTGSHLTPEDFASQIEQAETELAIINKGV